MSGTDDKKKPVEKRDQPVKKRINEGVESRPHLQPPEQWPDPKQGTKEDKEDKKK